MVSSLSQAEPPKLGRRIVRLFRPHRGALALIVLTILTTSALSVISALLVRSVFDKALFVQGGPDLSALYPLVAALIAIPIINGILNIVQVYLTEVVGNRVLQELRDRLFTHLEELSLAFYTATRSGEVQSRLANDVGGVQTTITSTASSVVSNVVAQGVRAPGARGRPLSRRECQPGQAPDPPGDRGAIVLRRHPGVLRDQSGAGLSGRRPAGHAR